MLGGLARWTLELTCCVPLHADMCAERPTSTSELDASVASALTEERSQSSCVGAVRVLREERLGDSFGPRSVPLLQEGLRPQHRRFGAQVTAREPRAIGVERGVGT